MTVKVSHRPHPGNVPSPLTKFSSKYERVKLTWRMSRNRKYVLATSWNCSNRLTGRKVMMLYLEVMMQLLW